MKAVQCREETLRPMLEPVSSNPSMASLDDKMVDLRVTDKQLLDQVVDVYSCVIAG